MTADLEHRRQAIVEALRAVMAEPFPDRVAQPQPVASSPEPRFDDPTPLRAGPPLILDPFPASPPAPPPLREALAAHIDWDEVEELETLDEDWEAPSVPPLETAGGMSRTASLALFGHA